MKIFLASFDKDRKIIYEDFEKIQTFLKYIFEIIKNQLSIF